MVEHFYSVVYVAAYCCTIIIQIMCYAVKVVKPSHCIRNFKKQISTVAEKFSLLFRTFSREISMGKIILSNMGNFSKPTSDQVGWKSGFNFYTDCAEVKFTKKQGTNYLRLVTLACYSLSFEVFSELFFRYFSLSLFNADQRVNITPTAFTPMEIYIGIFELHLLSK